MIAKHSSEQSEKGEGVEVVTNEPVEDPVHGRGQYTEKRIHLLRYGSNLSKDTCAYMYVDRASDRRRIGVFYAFKMPKTHWR
jgi:hypothetical protein